LKDLKFIVPSLLAGLLGCRSDAAPAPKGVEAPLKYAKAENVHKLMERFTSEPHPMGSDAQRKYARDVKAKLESFGWSVELQKFKWPAPNLEAARFGGALKDAPASKEISGENIVAVLKGNDECSILLGGHYDTKHYPKLKFVGANDGGSSTVAKIELARIISEQKKATEKSKERGRLLDCTLVFAFFDGEEAILEEWSASQRAIGVQDNLYGSRAFVQDAIVKGKKNMLQGQPLELVLIMDMIGHQKQKIFVTLGSDTTWTDRLLALKKDVNISKVPLSVEDDHVPFQSLGVPYLHLIDWTNLEEWHTAKDTPAIISNEKIAHFVEMIYRFLEVKR
jgi:hypothetical protein